MNNKELLKDQLNTMLNKAKRSVYAAQSHIKKGDYDFGSSRAYYAAFYAMEAVLLTKSLVFSKHSGVISAFNKHFIKTNIFPKEFSKLISHLFSERQIGDYEFDLSIKKEDAQEDVKVAEKFILLIEEYLKKERLI